MVGGNQVPRNEEIGTVQEAGPDGVTGRESQDQLTQEYLRATDRRTVGFQPQDVVTDQSTQLAGYDRNLGYDRIAVANTPLALRIDNITNLLARGERSAGNLQEVNRYYGRAQKEADDLFSNAAQNIMKGREDFQVILAAKTPQEVFAGMEASIQKQAQALQDQLKQEQDPARQRRLAQLLEMENDRVATLERMKQTQNRDELNRLLMYDAFTAQRIDLSHKMLNERNPAEVKLMAEAEMNLHTVQRAPGFTRANYGMLLMRLGQYDPNRPDNAALRALQDAASVDPEMVPNPNSRDPRRQMGDPNFMRVAAEITGLPQNDPRFVQALRPIFTRDINRSPSPTYDAGYSPTVAGDPRNPIRYSQVQNEGFVPTQGDTRLAATNTGALDQQRVTDQAAGVSPLVGGKTPLQRARELSQAYAQTGLTPEIRRGFESAVLDSDKGVSPRVAELQARLAQLEQKQKELMQQVSALQETPEIKELARQGMAKVEALPQADQQKFHTLKEQLGTVTDKAQREQILGELGKLSPEFVQVVRTLEERIKPHSEQIQQAAQAIAQEGMAVSQELVGEMNQASATRMEYAEKLMKSDKPEDQELGKRLLVESIAKASPELQPAFAAAAKQMGLTDQDIQRIASTQPQGEIQRTADGGVVTPQGDQTMGANNSPAGMFIDSNRRAFDAAQDKKAALAQMQDSFKKAMTDTDNEIGQFMQLSQAHAQLAAQMPEADKAKFQKMQAEGTSAQEKQALQQELMSKYSNMVQLESQMQTLVPSGEPTQLLLNQFRSRFEYARALNAAGDDATAKTVLTEGYSTLAKMGGKDAAAALVQERPEIGELTTKLGLDANALIQAASVEAQTTPGAITAGAGSLEDTLNNAVARMQKGDVTGAKEMYEKAIAMVDASFNPDENNAKIKAAQDALESGNLTIEQRFQKHQELSERFGAAFQAYNIRNQYAQILSHDTYGQNAAAEKAFKDAIVAADRVPVEAMKRQMGLLANDIGNFQTAMESAPNKERKDEIESAQSWLTKFSNTLNGQGLAQGGSAADVAWVNTQINARKNLASFYVRLVIDKDDQGKPIMKDDGTPRFIVDGSKVFKPEDAMKAIDEAKAKYKALHGVDLDADPTKDPSLLYLQKGIYDNSPAELQKKYSQVTRYFHESVTALPTLVAGVTTAILLSKFKPLRAFAGAGLEGAATSTMASSKLWGMSLLGGSAVASATHHTIMTQGFGRTDTTWGQSIAMGTGLTVGGVFALKSSHYFFRNTTDDTTMAIFKNSTGKQMGIDGKLYTQAEMQGMRGLPEFKHLTGQIDDAIRINENNTAILQKQFPGLKITDANKFLRDLPKQGTSDTWVIGGNRIGANTRLGQAIKANAGEYGVAINIPEHAAAFGKQGGMVLDKSQASVIKALKDNGFKVLDTADGGAVLEMKTIGEGVSVLERLASRPVAGIAGQNNPAKVAEWARAQIARLESTGLAAEANIAENMATATLQTNKGLIEFAANGGVPAAAREAKFFAQNGISATINDSRLANAGRFIKSPLGAATIGSTVGFGSEGIDYMNGGQFDALDGLTKSIAAGGLLYLGPRAVGGFRGAIRPLNAKVYGDIGYSTYGAGVVGGAGLYSASNYLPAWQQLAFERDKIDPNTGKPYDVSLHSAFVAPMWKSTTDNIFFNSLMLGGLAAKPGQAFMAGTPWQTWGKLSLQGWKGNVVNPVYNYAIRPVGATAVGAFTGSTWNSLGSAVGGEIGPAISAGLAIKSFDTFMQWQNLGAGDQYKIPLDRMNEPIVDDKLDPAALAQQRAAAQANAQKEAEALRQRQLQQQQQQQQQQQGENSDLVGGAPN